MSEPPDWPHFNTTIPGDTSGMSITVYYNITPEEKADQHGPHFPPDVELEVWWHKNKMDDIKLSIEEYKDLADECLDDAKERDEDDRNPL